MYSNAIHSDHKKTTDTLTVVTLHIMLFITATGRPLLQLKMRGFRRYLAQSRCKERDTRSGCPG